MSWTRLCSELKKDGGPCGAPAQIGKKVCIWHDTSPEAVAKRQAGRVKGAHMKPSRRLIHDDPPKYDTPADLKKAMGDVLNEVITAEPGDKTILNRARIAFQGGAIVLKTMGPADIAEIRADIKSMQAELKASQKPRRVKSNAAK